MALKSQLFSGDPLIAKCQTVDAAHILLGAIGDHVRKIHTALTILDNATIVDSEIIRMHYGPSTAKAVLAYKQKRRIVNRTYQSRADDIVGKMTISQLDLEMSALESRSRKRYCSGQCFGAPDGPITVSRSTIGSRAAFQSTQSSTFLSGSVPNLLAALSIQWVYTQAGLKKSGRKHDVLLPKATELLKPFQIHFVHTLGEGLVISNMNIPDPRFTFDTFAIREALEKVSPGNRNVLRVIVAPFHPQVGAFGITESGRSENGKTFPAFCLINASKLNPDHCTLLHEMIHAGLGLGENDHDTDNSSVFASGTAGRSFIKTEHAKGLTESFSEFPTCGQEIGWNCESRKQFPRKSRRDV